MTANLSLAERAAAHALTVVSRVSDAELTVPTPCPGWEVRHVLQHLADASEVLVALASEGERRLPGPPTAATASPGGHAEAGIRELLDALTAGQPAAEHDRRAAWAREAACGAAIELTAHAWDVAVARDPAAQVPDSLAEDVYDLATSLITDDARGRHFGARIEVSSRATAGERLLGLLGRDPEWAHRPAQR